MNRVIPLLTAAVVGASLLSACADTSDGASSGEAETVVVGGYPAEYEEVFMDVIAKPFTEKTGIKVEYSSGPSASEYYAQTRASRGEPGWDVAVGTQFEVFQGAKDGLLAPVTEKEVPNLAGMPDVLREATHGVGIIQDVQYVAMMYSKKAFPEAPTSWEAMWDPKYRSGALIFNPANLVGVFQLLIAAKLEGGGAEDIDPGFKRITELAKYAAGTPTASAEAVPFMDQGTATAFPYLDGRAAIYAATTDYDYTLPEEGSFASLGTLSIPSGAANKEAAYELMNFWLDPEVQRAWAEAYNVGPAVTGLEFDPEFAEKHVTTPEKLEQLELIDPQSLADNRSDWSQRWAEAVQ